VRKYLEAVLIERYEVSPEEATSMASAWRWGNGEELRSGHWHYLLESLPKSSAPSLDEHGVLGKELCLRLQTYAREQWFKEWQTTSEGKLTIC